MNRLTLTAIGAEVAALACGLVAYLNRSIDSLDDLPTFEGAYLNRSIREPAFSGVFGGDWFSPFLFRNPYLWLGAAIAFALTGVAVP